MVNRSELGGESGTRAHDAEGTRMSLVMLVLQDFTKSVRVGRVHAAGKPADLRPCESGQRNIFTKEYGENEKALTVEF